MPVFAFFLSFPEALLKINCCLKHAKHSKNTQKLCFGLLSTCFPAEEEDWAALFQEGSSGAALRRRQSLAVSRWCTHREQKREILSREWLALWEPCLESVRKRTRSLVGVSLQCQLKLVGNFPAHTQRWFCPQKTLFLWYHYWLLSANCCTT